MGCISSECRVSVLPFGEPCASQRCFPVPLAGQERKQRSELLEGLRSEATRLRQLHDSDLKGLQAELEGRLSALQQRHREKVSSRLCLWPLGLQRDGLEAPHLVTVSPCTAQGGRHKWQVTLPSLCFPGEGGAPAFLFNSAPCAGKKAPGCRE